MLRVNDARQLRWSLTPPLSGYIRDPTDTTRRAAREGKRDFFAIDAAVQATIDVSRSAFCSFVLQLLEQLFFRHAGSEPLLLQGLGLRNRAACKAQCRNDGGKSVHVECSAQVDIARTRQKAPVGGSN